MNLAADICRCIAASCPRAVLCRRFTERQGVTVFADLSLRVPPGADCPDFIPEPPSPAGTSTPRG